MFAAWKIIKLRRQGYRFLAFARQRLADFSERYPTAEKADLEAGLDSFERTLSGDDWRGMQTDLVECRRAVDRRLPFIRRHAVREMFVSILTAVVLALVLRAEIVQASFVPSGSMLPTIEEGDQMLVNKLIYGLKIPFTADRVPISKPQRGEIIVFQYPGDPDTDFIKRLVGLPGDTIKLRRDELIINGEPVTKTMIKAIHTGEGLAVLYSEQLGEVEHDVWYGVGYHANYNPALARQYDCCRTDGDADPYLVCDIPEGMYFFMGDNRDRSNDSRFWGLVPKHYLRGKATFVHFAWPPRQWRRIGTVLR